MAPSLLSSPRLTAVRNGVMPKAMAWLGSEVLLALQEAEIRAED